jgi:hypothetical protein
MAMGVRELESEVARLSREDLARFSTWFDAFVARSDRQIEADVLAGRLDHAGDRADADWVGVSPQPSSRAGLTVGHLRRSGLLGLWQDRTDIDDGSAYARQLREQVQQRGNIRHDFAR